MITNHRSSTLDIYVVNSELLHSLNFNFNPLTKKPSNMTSSKLLKVVFFIAIFLYVSAVSSSDPDPVFDFCVPTTNNIPSDVVHSCKNSSSVTVEDFVFAGIKSPGNFKTTGFASIPVSSAVFPGLNTLGMSFVRADFDVGGVNIPHYHPRATETAFVVEGKIYSGFVDTQNRIFAKVIEKGEVMVFPRGLVHFQMNVGDSPATIIGSFNSQNPGLVRIPFAVFGSDIREELLIKTFGLSAKELAKLRKRFD